MATALQMPTMDRSLSFEQQRARSTPPFASQYDGPPSPAVRPHSRTSSNASNISSASPYQQPSPNSYSPYTGSMYSVQPQAWPNTALPTSAFYPSHIQAYPNQPVFPQGFQQSQADFAAWTAAYQQMMMASVAGRGMPSPPLEFQGERRRTSSGPQTHHYGQSYLDPRSSQNVAQSPSVHHYSSAKQPQTFHPYKRDPHRPSRENVQMSRSTSQPTLSSTLDQLSPSSSMSSSRTPLTASDHQRSSSIDSAVSSVISRPETEHRKDTFPIASPAPRSAASVNPSPKPAPSSSTIKAVPTPLHTGPIANATNSLAPATNRSSPLSQVPMAPSPEPNENMVKSGGLKGRLRKALEKDSKRDGKASTPPSPAKSPPVSTPKHVFSSPSEASTRSATPPTTPSQDLPIPSPPFTNPPAMNSQVSLAETERTAIAPSEMTNGKGKRPLFRTRNMSTDNISLASTVSSASMMIRKMGSIGKLARRNSLMGISRIFKDKPKDEDAPMPEKEVKKKDKKSKKGKSEIAKAAVSLATAEAEDEDRALAGLSPAAKLARQHTLRSKAEADAETFSKQAESRSYLLPSIAGVAGPDVQHVPARSPPTAVHAVAVSDHEYDSEDDSSEGETVEDVTAGMGRTRLSNEADAEFQATWGNAYIDRYAVPKKGILKSITSIENFVASTDRQRSKSATFSQAGSPVQPATRVIDLYHPQPHSPPHHLLHGSFAPFDSPISEDPTSTFPYQNPSLNTSAPTMHLVETIKPTTIRSMTTPARRRILWAPECAVYSTYDAGTYDRRSEPATCNRLTPELAMAIKQELNAFKLEMPIHPASKVHTHYFA